ncbi:SDR family NAD(P)-dependent oxidoreductase [Niallia taxi]|uniref:SDR family NAD(P)-dependent oxidoreductase n=1 Tax=Niallia taxi TaxID=2499688 RepID=UPI003D26E171
MKRLENKTAVITGAAGGLGKYVSILFAEEGANLGISDVNEEKLLEVKEICESKGAKVFAKDFDLTKADLAKAFVDKTASNFGNVDILVNLAIAIKTPHSFMDHDLATLDESYQTGLVTTWNMMKFSFPYLKEKGGKIINCGSGAGYSGEEGYAAYAAIKEGIRGLSRVIAREWGKHNINVNIICPGAITDSIKNYLEAMPESNRDPKTLGFKETAIGRYGDAYEDIAPVVLFLSTEDSRHMTGQTFYVDGGAIINA